MKIGIVYPQTELGGSPDALRRIGLAVEELSFHHIMFYDHVVGAVHEGREPPLWGPYTEDDPFHDPFVAFGFLAGITKRIELATGILILPQRQTVLVAQQSGDADLLSGERLRLGVGTGWNYVEYDALGEDYAKRGPRLDEQVMFLRQLWTQHAFSFKGEFDSIERANINPRPNRSIPIWVGGFSEPAFRRAARVADGFIFAGRPDRDGGPVIGVLEAWARVQELLGDHDRAIDAFGADFIITPAISLADTVDLIKRWEDAGGTHVSLLTMGLGLSTTDAHLDYIAEVANKVGRGSGI